VLSEYIPYLSKKQKEIFSGEDVRIYHTGKLIHLYPDRIGSKNFYNTECEKRISEKKWVKRIGCEELMRVLYENENKLCDKCFYRIKLIKGRKDKNMDLLDFLSEDEFKNG
jgi:hypothetical protein